VNEDGDHPEAGLGIDPVEEEARGVGELDLDDRRRDPGRLGERGDDAMEALDERLVRQLRHRCPQLGHGTSLARKPSTGRREVVTLP
jgi:hypothetical protein